MGLPETKEARTMSRLFSSDVIFTAQDDDTRA